ncbi:PREDICTED: CREB/ATF bZIP transcription factor [Thamnophis sirtalis]|uniref:CREB/ATF bZIP transcription factor n=1 Tax=Thamnophis sirtalis TaxID=35019 RepID=A0A6I9XXM2_9SAUR|nr:PREDICTED: CREB/ATF bZIP transcription factor [Thamnophis sirtalis]XP_013918556.1 PREDICTED: CREB/ATF bZIP transcription factor [Thamnophis sirtalis]
MRHSLAQLLAASSGRGKPGEAVAACSFPGPGAERRPEEETETAAAAAMTEDSLEDPDDDDLLFPADLELDAWLEAAVGGGEASPPSAWDGASPPAEAAEPSSSSRPARPCSNRLKAAAAARLNRQKKKLYVQGLETRLQGLAAENRQLRDRNRGLCRRLRDLERETGYLRAVLANQSALGRLLGRLAGDGSLGLRMRISSSLFQETAAGAFGENGDHDYALPIPEEEPAEKLSSSSRSPGGVCLHVDRDHLSVEFCSLCAKRAASSETLAAASSSSLPPLPPSAAASSLLSKIFSFRCLPCQAPLCRG